jgi:replicative DNA helicase
MQLPYDMEIEKSVLGVLIISDEHQDNLATLTDEHFYYDTHKAILKIMKWQHKNGKVIDTITVSEMLQQYYNKNGINESAIDVVIKLVQNTSVYNFIAYREKLQGYFIRRTFIKRANEVVELAINKEFSNNMDLQSEMLEKFDIRIETESSADKYKASNILINVLDNIENRKKNKVKSRLLTGFREIDAITAGLHKKDLSIIAAPPAHGKTTFAAQLIKNLLMKGNNVIFFSCEMGREQILERMLSSISKIDGNKLRNDYELTDNDWAKITHATGIISEFPFICNDDVTTIEQMRLFCREQKNKGLLDVIVIDYLGLVRTIEKTYSKEDELSRISRAMKLMAKEFDCPVVSLCQLNREGRKGQGEGQKNGREPVLSDLRGSGAIEQDSDNVFFLWSQTVYEERDDDVSKGVDVRFIIAKQRNGAVGSVNLKWYKPVFTYYGK